MLDYTDRLPFLVECQIQSLFSSSRPQGGHRGLAIHPRVRPTSGQAQAKKRLAKSPVVGGGGHTCCPCLSLPGAPCFGMDKPLAKLVAMLTPKRRWALLTLTTMFVVVSVLCLWLSAHAFRAEPLPADVVSSWANLGIRLPPHTDIELMRARLPESLEALREGLHSNNNHVRMSSAYVAEQLGPQAGPFVSDLLTMLRSEPKPIVRVYVASALFAIDQFDSDSFRQLQECFRSEEDQQVKTVLAGTLVRFHSSEEEPDAWQWLLHSLDVFPPDPPEDPDEQHLYWERRWAAVQCLRQICGNENVVLPLLKALKAHPKTPQWVVFQQIDEAIMEMESQGKRSTE